MRIVDAHTHIYERINGYGGRGELRPVGDGVGRWANGDAHRLIPAGMSDSGFSAEQLIALMDATGVERAVILQGNLYGFQNLYIDEAVRKYPDRLSGACAVDPFARMGEQVMAHLLDEVGFRAAKFEFSDNCGLMSFHQPFALDCERMRVFYRMLAERDATLVVDIGARGMDSYQPDAITRIAQEYPELRIVVCHLMAHRRGEGELLAKELEPMCRKNVWFDLAALPWNTGEAYPFEEARGYARLAREIAGSEKLIWGSDCPGVILDVSYADLLNYLMDGVFAPQEREAVFSGNARDAYRF